MSCTADLLHPEHALNPRWRLKRVLEESGGLREDVLEAFGIERAWLERFPRELSGGELQRFCVARALMSAADYLVCDEISTMLDVITQAQIWNAILQKRSLVIRLRRQMLSAVDINCHICSIQNYTANMDWYHLKWSCCLQICFNFFNHFFIFGIGEVNLVRIHLESGAPLIPAFIFRNQVHMQMAAGITVSTVVYFVGAESRVQRPGRMRHVRHKCVLLLVADID